jgi:hypothetical protein
MNLKNAAKLIASQSTGISQNMRESGRLTKQNAE